MNVIDMTRQLGKAIQEDDRYNDYVIAKAANDSDSELQELIASFNSTRTELNMEMSKKEKNSQRISELDTKLRELYDDVMSNPRMAAFDAAKAAMDSLLESINFIITAAANGQDPLTCPENAPSCGGSCSTCGGCH